MSERIEGIRKMLIDPVEQTAPNNQARGWRSDCEYLLAEVDVLLADLRECAPLLRELAHYCEACEGSGEIMISDDHAEECKHCRPIWDLEERINPSPLPPLPPKPVYEDVDDDIPF